MAKTIEGEEERRVARDRDLVQGRGRKNMSGYLGHLEIRNGMDDKTI